MGFPSKLRALSSSFVLALEMWSFHETFDATSGSREKRSVIMPQEGRRRKPKGFRGTRY
jgi:hypothetical protein